MKNCVLKNKVEKGIKYLDEGGYPGDWASKIDTEKLDLEADDTCVLGQLFGSYNGQASVYGYKKLIELGFQLRNKHDKKKNWNKLGSIWASRIKERQFNRQEQTAQNAFEVVFGRLDYAVRQLFDV